MAGFDMKNMMQKAQQLQAQMTEIQRKLDTLEVEGISGGGLVKLKVTGKGELKSIHIDSSLLKLDEKEVLEDLIVAAMNDGRNRSETLANDEMTKITGGMQLPGGLKLPF